MPDKFRHFKLEIMKCRVLVVCPWYFEWNVSSKKDVSPDFYLRYDIFIMKSYTKYNKSQKRKKKHLKKIDHMVDK